MIEERTKEAIIASNLIISKVILARFKLESFVVKTVYLLLFDHKGPDNTVQLFRFGYYRR